MNTFYGNIQEVSHHELAKDTILHLHQFLVRNVNPSYAPISSPLYARPYTATTCQLALVYFSNGGFVGGNYRIKVEKQENSSVPHFQYSQDSNGSKHEIFMVSESARIALEEYAMEMQKREQMCKILTPKDPLIPNKEPSSCFRICSLF